jgi:hypothetical protein
LRLIPGLCGSVYVWNHEMLKDWNNHVTLPSNQLHVITWFILALSPFSLAFVTQSLILPCHSFPLSYLWLWWFTLERYLWCTLYIVKGKENSKEFRGIPSGVDIDWDNVKGWERKNQGFEYGADANNRWAWVKPPIGFLHHRKVWSLFFILLRRFLPFSWNFSSSFFSFFLSFPCPCFRRWGLTSLLFDPCSFSFFSRILICWGDSFCRNFLFPESLDE